MIGTAVQYHFLIVLFPFLSFLLSCTHGLVAMTSASHAKGRQFDPGFFVDASLSWLVVGDDPAHIVKCSISRSFEQFIAT